MLPHMLERLRVYTSQQYSAKKDSRHHHKQKDHRLNSKKAKPFTGRSPSNCRGMLTMSSYTNIQQCESRTAASEKREVLTGPNLEKRSRRDSRVSVSFTFSYGPKKGGSENETSDMQCRSKEVLRCTRCMLHYLTAEEEEGPRCV